MPKDKESAKSLKSPQEIQEEIGFLRQKASSLTFRGQYSECIKLIEDNLAMLYFGERWPEQFLAVMLLHKKCYPSLDRGEPYDDYAMKVLEKHHVPTVFVELMKHGGRDVTWTSEFFRDTALDLRREKEYSRALGYAELYLKMEPHNSNAFLLKGWVLEDLERADEARGMYEQSLELNASNLQAVQSIARAYSVSDPAKALEYVDKALLEHPDEAGFHAARGQILAKLGKPAEAMEAWERAAELDPYQAAYPYEKGELLLAEGKEAPAIAQYRRAVVLNERHIPSQTRLAYLLAEQTPEAALEAAHIAVNAEPENLDLGLLYGELLRRCGDNAAADRQYRRLLERDENDHRVWAGLARLYRSAEPEKALEYFDRAITLSPQHAEYHMGKAVSLEALDRREEAVSCYLAAGLAKMDAAPLGALGRLLAETKPQEALAYFDKAIRLSPKTADYYSGKAAILQTMPGKTQEALDTLELACTYDPGNAALHCRIGLLLEKTGNRASSIRHYEEATSLDPALDECYAGIARQLATTRPHRALTAINHAIGRNLTNAEYYYWKAVILSRLAGDDYALSQLELTGQDAGTKEHADEIASLRSGDALRMALFFANRAVELAPKNNTFLCLRAKLLADMGQDTQAREQYEALLKHDRDNHEALYGHGRLLAKRGEDKKAEADFDHAIRVSPETAAYHAAKADLLAKDPARYAEAVASYQTAIPLDTLAWEPILALAKLLDENGDFSGAMESYRRCLLIYRDCLPATARMGRLLYEKKPLAALQYIQQAIRLDEDNWTHRAWLGCILYRLNRPEGAAEAMSLAARMADDGAETYFQFAEIMTEELPEQAMKYCRRAIELEPGRSDYYVLLGDLLAAAGDSDGVLEAYSQACRLNEQNHAARARLAECLYLRGDPESLSAIEKAVAAAPGEAGYLLLKAKIQGELTGELEAAIQTAEAAIKRNLEDIPLREELVDLLQRKRSFLRLPLEKAKLERLRRRRQKDLAAEADTEEISFEEEAAAENPSGEGETERAKADSAVDN